MGKVGGELFRCGMRKIEDVGDDLKAGEGNVMLAADPSESGAFHVLELGAVLKKDFKIALGVVEGVSGREDGGGEIQLLSQICCSLRGGVSPFSEFFHLGKWDTVVVIEDGGRDDEGVAHAGRERGVRAAGSRIEHLGDPVMGDEVVGDEGGGFGSDAICSGGLIFARGGDEEVSASVVGADDRLGGEGNRLQGIENSLGLGLHGNVERAHLGAMAFVGFGCKADAIWERNWNCQG